jgi:hypothetical protein
VIDLDVTLLDATRRALVLEISWLHSSGLAVIIEEPNSGKFVQFGWKTLMVDLPIQTLSDDEMQRAERVMARFQIPKRTAESLSETSFQKHLGDDVDLAVRVTEAVFREIYLFPKDISLKFTRVE